MAENFLKYTNLTYDTIDAQIRDKINADTRFDNPRESAIFQTITEIFSGTTDLVNYYIQRRAEECYFDTAQLKSSIILLARQLGYVVTRPTPAKSKLKIVLEGDFTDVFAPVSAGDNKIQLPYYSKFSHGGKDFVLVDTFTYNVTPTLINEMVASGSDFEKEIVMDSFGNDIVIAQGTIREKTVVGNSNVQVGSNFQAYKFEDREFSNIYGDEDYFFNDVTKVWVGNEKTESTRYQIDRRSLINWESLESNDLSTASKVCLLRTTPDEYIELIFGDGAFAAKGALTREDNVYIQYLATEGKAGNSVGVIDEKVNFAGKVFTNTGVEITDKVKFKLYANITGGADIESNDSIKFSAPRVYYSLDRLVSKSDYVNYLKSLKRPIDVQNAIAWGEQEERDLAGVFADIKMFNVTLFSVVGSLYNLDNEIYTVRTQYQGLNESVLDLDYDPYSIHVQSYFNVYTRQAIAHQLKKYDVLYYTKRLVGGLPLSGSPAYFRDAYGDNGIFNFHYGTDTIANASNISTSGTVTIDFSSLASTSNMSEVADKINDEIASFTDARANTFDNANYDDDAFDNGSDAIVGWDNENQRFVFTFGVDSPCYITSAFGPLAEDLNLSQTIETVAHLESEEMSGKITEVVGNLDTRAQMNIKNIYVSPIIHNFNLEGTVYVKALYDKEALRTEINNSVYEWLNINADYNEPIYISNIVELIEKHPGIIHADVKIVPEDITAGINNRDNKWYYGWQDQTIAPYGAGVNLIVLFFLHNFLNETSTFKSIDEVRRFYNTASWTWIVNGFPIQIPVGEVYTLEEKKYYLHNYINERNFMNSFMKGLFDWLLNAAETQEEPANGEDPNGYTYRGINGGTVTNYRRFIGYNSPQSLFNSFNRFYAVTNDSDFIKAVTKIHKDLSYIIKLNMIDSHGNITVEYDSEDNFVRGGYSLGSEIVKMNLQPLNYEYK